MLVDSLSATLALPYEPRQLSERSFRLQRLGNTVTYQRSREAVARVRLAAAKRRGAPQPSKEAASADSTRATATELLASPAAIIAASWAAWQSRQTCAEPPTGTSII